MPKPYGSSRDIKSSSTRRLLRSCIRRCIKSNNDAISLQGLDKFDTVLSDEKKQKIYGQLVSSQEDRPVIAKKEVEPVEQIPKTTYDGKTMNTNIGRWSPCLFFVMVMVAILLFLVIYGKSFAILCTTGSWFLVPTIKSKNLKDYARRLRSKKMDLVI
ncbi:hypothetical protein IFM89_020365 [Coptis chinensis]|uniref:Uncharacterized protein n=1 Tax=Coptis chinensis TaxID=261450 RepID=A0A835LQV4_9MAGN|nr:hypothetical protein IFM89_020365 [Coptis chinensis]